MYIIINILSIFFNHVYINIKNWRQRIAFNYIYMTKYLKFKIFKNTIQIQFIHTTQSGIIARVLKKRKNKYNKHSTSSFVTITMLYQIHITSNIILDCLDRYHFNSRWCTNEPPRCNV